MQMCKLFFERIFHLEIKINKEIREYSESIFFGLSLRQFVCAILAVAATVGSYFGLRNYLGDNATSWVCIVGAAPFAALGFLRYNGIPGSGKSFSAKS